MMHCGAWRNATETYVLQAEKSLTHLSRQVLMSLSCPNCDKQLYAWYGVLKTGAMTSLTRIHPREFEADWRDRLLRDALPVQAGTRQRLMVSEYSRQIARAADKTARYLRYIQSASHRQSASYQKASLDKAVSKTYDKKEVY